MRETACLGTSKPTISVTWFKYLLISTTSNKKRATNCVYIMVKKYMINNRQFMYSNENSSNTQIIQHFTLDPSELIVFNKYKWSSFPKKNQILCRPCMIFHACLFLHFKSAFKIIWIFIYFFLYFKLIFFLVFSYHFDILMSNFFKKNKKIFIILMHF